MRTSIDELDLPGSKEQELQSITDTIVELVKPVMVILFGSYARGTWVEEWSREDGIATLYKSDYDILVVTEKAQDMPPRLGKEIRRRVKRAEKMQTPPHIIFHDIGYLNKELEDGAYFFVDILKEGILLYNAGRCELATPRILSPKDRAHKARIYFDTWYKNAEVNLKFYNYARKDEVYHKAAFELHQAAEGFFRAIELVFTDYKSKTHDLHELYKIAGYQDARFKIVFPNQTDEEKRLFEILVKAYIDSRYKLNYFVSPADLQWLAGRIEILKDLTKKICEEKIESYRNAD